MVVLQLGPKIILKTAVVGVEGATRMDRDFAQESQCDTTRKGHCYC